MSIIEDYADINKRLKELKPDRATIDQAQQSQVLSGAEWLNELRQATGWPSNATPDLIPTDQQSDSIDYTCLKPADLAYWQAIVQLRRSLAN